MTPNKDAAHAYVMHAARILADEGEETLALALKYIVAQIHVPRRGCMLISFDSDPSLIPNPDNDEEPPSAG